MLGRLFRQEMRATSRLFLPLMAGYLAVTVLCKFSFESVYARTVDNRLLETIAILFFILYFVYTVALFVMTAVFIVMHFYKTMVGDQGYLTNTLPIKTSGIVSVKLLAAVLWQILAGILLVLSFSVFAMGHVDFDDVRLIWNSFLEFYEQASLYTNMPLQMLKLFIYAVTGLISGPLMLYTAIALGHLFEKHRVMLAVVAYFAIHFILQSVRSMCSSLFDTGMGEEFFQDSLPFFRYAAGVWQDYLLFSVVFDIVVAIGLYAVTSYVFSRRLNLD